LFNSIGTSLFVTIGNNGGSYASHVLEYSLSTAYDISTLSASPVSAYSVASQETDPHGIAFNSNGSKMYIVGTGNDTIFQYSTGTATTLDLSTGNYFSHTPSANTTFAFSNAPASGTAAGFALALTGANVGETYDLANASYDSVSFSVASQETVPNNIGFNDDGTSMYIIGSVTDAIYQYTLSTAWDLSTASYASKSLSISGETTPRDFTFNNDGTKIYYVGSGTDTVYQYSLSTAYDISTASTDNKSLYVGSQAGTPTGIEFKSDGTKLYVCDGGTDTIYQYSLSTAFDVSTGSYDSVSFSFSNQGTNTQSIFFTPNGTSLFVCDTANDAVYKYSLSTAWDVSTLSYANESFSLAGQDDPFGVAFKSDGSKMYMVGVTSDTVYQYTTGSTATATFTYPSSVKFPNGIAPAGPAIGETDVLVFYTDDGGTTYQGFQAGDAMA
jgi:DNA-binding beta-propeller fold protein YncE